MAFALSLVVGHWLFPHLSSNNDEPIYVLQAETFRHGHLTLSAPAHDDFFRPWMSGAHGDRLFLVVQPVLPALLAVSDLLFGSMRIALALIAAGAVVAVFSAVREVLKNDRVAVVAAAFFTLSPFVIVQSALFVTYVLAVLLTATVITFVSRGLERGSRAAFLLAGLVYGVLLVLRPIEGVMLGLALVVWVLARRDSLRSVLRGVATMIVGTLPIVVLMLVYNRATTGNPLRFPLWAIGGNDAFGFGDRWIVENAPHVHYGLGQAWLTLRTNLRAFPHWLLGGVVTVPLMAWGGAVAWKKHRAALALLLAIAVIYPAGYFFYWGNYLIISGRNFFGPHYYMGLLIPAVALLGLAVDDLLRRPRRVVVTLALVPLLVAGTAIEVGDKIRINEHFREFVQGEVDALHAAVSEPAIVVVPAGPDGAYILHPRGAFANEFDLSDRTLYAADLLSRNIELFDRYPDRGVYRLQELKDSKGQHPDVRRLTRRREPGFDLDITATAKPGQHLVATYASAEHQFFAACVLTHAATAGQVFHVSAHLATTGVTLHGCEGGDVTTPRAAGTTDLAIGVAGSPGGDAFTGERVEQRYWVRTDGSDLELISPADTWYRPGTGTPFVVADPAFDTLGQFSLR